MIVYVDTSAAMKLVVEERESAMLAEDLQRKIRDGDTLVASLLVHTELHCATNRRPEQVEHEAVSDLLATIALVDLENGDLTTAPLLPGRLTSADATHLATALRLNADAMVVYGADLRAAARTAGIRTCSPGAAWLRQVCSGTPGRRIVPFVLRGVPRDTQRGFVFWSATTVPVGCGPAPYAEWTVGPAVMTARATRGTRVSQRVSGPVARTAELAEPPVLEFVPFDGTQRDVSSEW